MALASIGLVKENGKTKFQYVVFLKMQNATSTMLVLNPKLKITALLALIMINGTELNVKNI